MLIITRIIDLTKKRGLKQSYVCEQLGLERTWMQTVKKQNSNISDERLEKIAVILNTTVAYLKGETDDPLPQKQNGPSELDELLNDQEFIELFREYREMPESKKKLVHALFLTVKNEV